MIIFDNVFILGNLDKGSSKPPPFFKSTHIYFRPLRDPQNLFVFHLSIITSYKKYLKISLLPLTKKVSLKSFNQYCLQCKYISVIIIYKTICIDPMKI